MSDFLTIALSTMLAVIATCNIRRADRAEAALARIEATIRECEIEATR